MYLENVGTTYKTAMDALNNYFEPKTNVVFERYVFCQAIQETKESQVNFITRLRKLASTCEFADQNTKIRNQFIDKCSPNRLSRRVPQEPNLTLEKVIEKAQALELAEKQSMSMQPDVMQAGMASLNIIEDKNDFHSNKYCFRCGCSTNFANKCNIAKGKTSGKSGKEGHFTTVCKSKPQKLPVNLLQNESSSD